MATLRDDLETNRKGYDAEGVWLRFLLDSFTGGGGYQGRVKQPPAGYWGAAAEAYSPYSLIASGEDYAKAEETSYLDRFPREQIDKFTRRVNVAHYLNYCAPITSLKVSYIVRKPHKRQKVPPALAEWITRANYDRDFRTRALAAAVMGWFPMLVDQPSAPSEAETLAQAEEMVGGTLDPYVVQLLPCHLRDYQLDDKGEFVWAKVAQVREVKDSWQGECKTVTRYTIWTRTDYEVYETVGDGEPQRIGERRRHDFGKVPIVSWRADTNLEGDKVKAQSMIADIALEGRRLFNLISELDEHIRSQVFALLVVPRDPNSTGNEKLNLGSAQGLLVTADQKNLPMFLAPPATVAATLETRAEKSVIEIYRIARVEYDRASGVHSSAQSKQQNFEQTNAALCDFAAALAQDDYRTLCLVGTALGCSPAELAEMECVPYTSYATEDLAVELEQAVEAITSLAMIGVRAKVALLQRLVRQLIPNLSAEDQKAIDSEIQAEVEQADKDAKAAATRLAEDESEPPDNPPPPDTDNEEEDEQEAA